MGAKSANSEFLWEVINAKSAVFQKTFGDEIAAFEHDELYNWFAAIGQDQTTEFFSVEHGVISAVCLGAPALHPIDGGRELRLHTILADSHRSSIEKVQSWLKGILATSYEDGLRAVEADVPAGHQDLKALFEDSDDWGLEYCLISKSIASEVHRSSAVSNCRIRRSRDNDLPFVRSLWRESVFNGLRTGECESFSAQEIDAAADRQLDEIRTAPLSLVLIAECEGKAVATAIASVKRMYEVSGRLEPVVHDVFVQDTARNQGVAMALHKAVELVYHHCGFQRIYGTVRAFEGRMIEMIIESLLAGGWRPVVWNFRSSNLGFDGGRYSNWDVRENYAEVVFLNGPLGTNEVCKMKRRRLSKHNCRVGC